LRKARKHFWKGYVLMIAGTILGGVERILPSGPLKTAAALVSVASLGASAFQHPPKILQSKKTSSRPRSKRETERK